MYSETQINDEIRQGDIFSELPWLLFNPCDIGVQGKKCDISKSGFSESALVTMHAAPSYGIVTSADCDCERNLQINVCKIVPLAQIEPSFPLKNQKNQIESKLKYADKIGIYYLRGVGSMLEGLVEFNQHLTFPREFLIQYKHKRIATLIEEGRHHLREKIAHYQTRFGPDKRYILTEEELKIAEDNSLL